MMRRMLLAVLVSAAGATAAPAQYLIRKDAPDRTIDAAEKKDAIDGVLAALEKHYVFPEVATKMSAAVRDRQAKGEYDAVTSGKEFARLLTDHLREVCKDKHLGVAHAGDAIPDGPPKEPPTEVRERVKRMAAVRNNGFRKVEQLPGGVGLLALDGFMTAEEIGDTAAAAMSFLANSDAVIVDLRQNGGGDPAAVILLCSYFFDRQTHLNSIYNRSENTTRDYWTHPAVPGKKLAGKDVYVLTSGRTFSGAEEFAYNLQSQKRATVIGETTGGGAHPTRGVRAAEHYLALVPFARSVNPVTKTNWEGTGVKPDVAVPADDALTVAHLAVIKKKLAANPAEPEAGELKELAVRLEKKQGAGDRKALPAGGDVVKPKQ